MEVLELFPRYLLKGNLAKTLLSSLQILAKEVLKAPERSPNASHKLAGQLALQLELGPQQPAVQELLGHSDAISAAFIQHLLSLCSITRQAGPISLRRRVLSACTQCGFFERARMALAGRETSDAGDPWAIPLACIVQLRPIWCKGEIRCYYCVNSKVCYQLQ